MVRDDAQTIDLTQSPETSVNKHFSQLVGSTSCRVPPCVLLCSPPTREPFTCASGSVGSPLPRHSVPDSSIPMYSSWLDELRGKEARSHAGRGRARTGSAVAATGTETTVRLKTSACRSLHGTYCGSRGRTGMHLHTSIHAGAVHKQVCAAHLKGNPFCGCVRAGKIGVLACGGVGKSGGILYWYKSLLAKMTLALKFPSLRHLLEFSAVCSRV